MFTLIHLVICYYCSQGGKVASCNFLNLCVACVCGSLPRAPAPAVLAIVRVGSPFSHRIHASMRWPVQSFLRCQSLVNKYHWSLVREG